MADLSQAVYYLNRACDYSASANLQSSCPSTFYARAPPAGLRMVVGNPTLRYVNASFTIVIGCILTISQDL